jgi:hypothetical protein
MRVALVAPDAPAESAPWSYPSRWVR